MWMFRCCLLIYAIFVGGPNVMRPRETVVGSLSRSSFHKGDVILKGLTNPLDGVLDVTLQKKRTQVMSWCSAPLIKGLVMIFSKVSGKYGTVILYLYCVWQRFGAYIIGQTCWRVHVRGYGADPAVSRVRVHWQNILTVPQIASDNCVCYFCCLWVDNFFIIHSSACNTVYKHSFMAPTLTWLSAWIYAFI